MLFGKTKSALPLILACSETIGYGFLNSKGLYLGYPLDVLKKVRVSTLREPYAMPSLYSRKLLGKLTSQRSTRYCGCHCPGVWRTLGDSAGARHTWWAMGVVTELQCTVQVQSEECWWKIGETNCRNVHCSRYNSRMDYRAPFCT